MSCEGIWVWGPSPCCHMEEEIKFFMYRFKVGKLTCGFVSLILVVAAVICREPYNMFLKRAYGCSIKSFWSHGIWFLLIYWDFSEVFV